MIKIGKTREMSLLGVVFWLLSIGALFGYPAWYTYTKYYVVDPDGYLKTTGVIFLGLIAMTASLYFVIVAFRTPASPFRTFILSLLGVMFFMGLRETAIKMAVNIEETAEVFWTFALSIAGAGGLNIIGFFFDWLVKSGKEKKKMGV